MPGKIRSSREGDRCFRDLVDIVGRLSTEDSHHLLISSLQHEVKPSRLQQTLVDAMGVSASDACLTAICDLILKNKTPDHDLVSRSLFHLVNVKTHLPKVGPPS